MVTLMPTAAPLRCCTRCGILKPPDSFYVVRGQRESRCKDCENARRRHRDHIRYTAVSDITPEQELAMRHKTRKCPLCRVFMTGKPGRPNSKHLDHIVPLGIGGTHTHGNVRIICATCNLKRPKDGSDYIGPVTLWAQGEIAVSRPDRRAGRVMNLTTCRKGLHPWVPENIKITSRGTKRCRACEEAKDRQRRPLRPCPHCGLPTALPGSQAMCQPCIEAAARKAAELHASGLSWNQVAPLVGYGTAEGVRYAAKRVGYVPAPRPVKDVRPRCPDCGQPAAKRGRGRQCQACIGAKARRAVHLRTAEGWTLRMIADELGYSSITAVTNLMKTVVPIKSKMGRPPS